MYPASFEYFAPETIDEALTILERFGDEGKVLAGGQSLIPLMKLRFAAPRAVVDINRIAGLDGLGEDDGRLRIGALVRHKACERSALLHGRWGTLGDAAPQISDPLVRNLGTVGRAGIAMTGVGPINLRATAAEEALAGNTLDDAAIAEAARLAAEAAEPLADVRGSVEYKRNAIRVLTARGLRHAAEVAREEPRDDGEQFAGHETVEGVMDEIEEKDQ